MVARVPHKFQWFLDHEYEPHIYQIIFHSMWDEADDRLCRFRHLVAGRRGGKTLSAAWETVYYAMHPEFFHWDVHRVQKEKPLHIWVLTPDFRSAGRAAKFTMREVLRQAGLKEGHDYQENKGEMIIEFSSGTMLEYKTAERPEQLVGAGLDIMWMDEAAVIPDENAWNVARPALADKEGIVIGTTTPRGKNWLYEMFWNQNALQEPDIGRVEYRSIDNPHFPRREWEKERRRYHPIMFKREYMASFDAMSGVELSGEWLHYYAEDDLPVRDNPLDTPYGQYDLTLFIGVDPAISLADSADRFSMALIGVSKSGSVYLLEQYAGRIQFPEQVVKIEDWFNRYQPTYIGLETTAYQAALAQQVVRLDGLPPVVDIPAKGKKFERIMAMAPLFKIGKVKIRTDHMDFIDEWLSYDSQLKNPKDDCLDAVEIALRAAGALFPQAVDAAVDTSRPAADVQELADRALQSLRYDNPFDDHLGEDW